MRYQCQPAGMPEKSTRNCWARTTRVTSTGWPQHRRKGVALTDSGFDVQGGWRLRRTVRMIGALIAHIAAMEG
jgi:hypothetical protein